MLSSLFRRLDSIETDASLTPALKEKLTGLHIANHAKVQQATVVLPVAATSADHTKIVGQMQAAIDEVNSA